MTVDKNLTKHLEEQNRLNHLHRQLSSQNGANTMPRK